jgi:hypothetical protein
MTIDPLKPKEEKNFFTAEEYDEIYKVINHAVELGINDSGDKWQHFKKLTNNGFIAYFFSEHGHDPNSKLLGLPKKVQDKIREKFEKESGAPVEHLGMLWARYTLESGDIPTLMPHKDRSETHTAFMFTVELESNINWDFYVEDEKFEMEKNKGIWFSGTHQSHWRPDIKFKNGDFYDIILCQTHSSLDDNPLSEEHYLEGDMYSNDLAKKYDKLLKNTIAKSDMIDGFCQ